MGIYRLNGNFAVRLKALQLYIYWGALKGNSIVRKRSSTSSIVFAISVNAALDFY